MWKKIIMDFLAPSHLSKSVRVTGSKIGYIPPALRIWKGSVDVFEPSNKEMIWTTVITSTSNSDEPPISYSVATSVGNSDEPPIPTTLITSTACSTEVGGV